MITRQLIKTRKIVIVEVKTDFQDPYMAITFPFGSQYEVDLDKYRKGKTIKTVCAGHGIHLSLSASEVRPIKAFVEKTIVETEFFEL